MQPVLVEKLVHGGQGIATLETGKRILLWNVLPGERVVPRVIKDKRGMCEGVAEEIINPSPERQAPLDEAYLSTSPWQIMSWEAENRYKRDILHETMLREHVTLTREVGFYTGEQQLHYRNKMEYSFWADEDGLHLALFRRASHGKQIVNGSSIARPEIDSVAGEIVSILNAAKIRGSQLKTVVLRCNQAGETVAALFVKDETFPKLKALGTICRGVTVCYSNPKSPASVLTKELHRFGEISLNDKVLQTDLTYDVHSFFQVNVPVFEQAAGRIRELTAGSSPIVDFYSGVGTIGLPVSANILVELDARNVEMMKQNANGREVEIIQASAETALEYIASKGALIVDPPRAGLHQKVTQQILEVQPPVIAYLSCNPITQARDIALLQERYELTHLEGFNFFPRTPHIESLAILKKR